MEKIVIVRCNCQHAYQDAQYGINNRVANFAPKQSSPNVGGYRCTVCNTVHQISENGEKIEDTKKKKK